MTDSESELDKGIAAYTARHGISSLSSEALDNPPSLVLHLGENRYGGLIIDMPKLHYVSSTGFGASSTAMIEYGRERLGSGSRGAPPRVKTIFETLGFLDYFTFMEDRGNG